MSTSVGVPLRDPQPRVSIGRVSKPSPGGSMDQTSVRCVLHLQRNIIIPGRCSRYQPIVVVRVWLLPVRGPDSRVYSRFLQQREGEYAICDFENTPARDRAAPGI